MWRPEDWKNPHPEVKLPREAYTHIYYDIYEDGADAMYEAKVKIQRSLKEIRVKLVDVAFEYMTVPEFIEWVYNNNGS